jgi:hypothetical protein
VCSRVRSLVTVEMHVTKDRESSALQPRKVSRKSKKGRTRKKAKERRIW